MSQKPKNKNQTFIFGANKSIDEKKKQQNFFT